MVVSSKGNSSGEHLQRLLAMIYVQTPRCWKLYRTTIYMSVLTEAVKVNK